MKYRSPREELDYLTYRDLSSRAARTTRKSPPKPEAEPATVSPEIHVHVDMPAIPEAKEEKKEATPSPTVRKWRFDHKYDRYNKLTETIATAE